MPYLRMKSGEPSSTATPSHRCSAPWTEGPKRRSGEIAQIRGRVRRNRVGSVARGAGEVGREIDPGGHHRGGQPAFGNFWPAIRAPGAKNGLTHAGHRFDQSKPVDVCASRGACFASRQAQGAEARSRVFLRAAQLGELWIPGGRMLDEKAR